MVLHQSDCWVRAFIADGIYEPKVTDYILQHSPYRTTIDIGANCGYYSVLLARLSDEEFALEPDPRTFRALAYNTRNLRNVERYRVAASEDESIRPFSLADQHGQSGFHYPQMTTQIDIDTVPVDWLIPPDRCVDLIKIDAEGHEPEILKGMRRIRLENPHLKIICETELQNIYEVSKEFEGYERQQLDTQNVVFEKVAEK
jgi:FkbM family methyltransferase